MKLYFVPKTIEDFDEMDYAIKHSVYYAEVYDIAHYFEFDVNDSMDANNLERSLTRYLIAPNSINGHFELEH